MDFAHQGTEAKVPRGFSYETIVKDQAQSFLQENLRNTLRNRLVEK